MRPINKTLSGITTPGPSGTESNENEGVLHIPEISKAGASLSNYLCRTLVGEGVLRLCWDAVGKFYSPSGLGCI